MNIPLHKKLDLLIISAPMARMQPFHGPAILKAFLQEQGLNVKCFDFNQRVWSALYKKYGDLANSSLWSIEDEFEKVWELDLVEITFKMIDHIKHEKPRWLGISMFTYDNSKLFICKFLTLLRRCLPDLNVVVGGHGISVIGEGEEDIFGAVLKKQNLADEYIHGEGEINLLNLLRNNEFKRSKDIVNLDLLPYPDYSDLKFNGFCKNLEIGISGSRGCVNSCDFCNGAIVKYREKSPMRIISEMIYLFKRYEVGHFSFTDSNWGLNVSNFEEMANLIKYNIGKKNLPSSLTISGLTSVWSKTQMTNEIFQKLRSAGLKNYFGGVESGSYKLRQKMGKRIYNDDILHMVSLCESNKINAYFSFIIGHPLEEDDDFLESLNLVRQMAKESPSGNIKIIAQRFRLYKESRLYIKRNELGIIYNTKDDWSYKKSNTNIIRINRMKCFVELLKELKIENANIYARRNNH